MLAIRLQRTGRKGHAHYRVIVQESRKSPTSGRVIAYVGSYDPHTKSVSIKTQEAQKYLDNGAQPSERVAGLLKSEGVKLPKWVTFSDPKERTTRNPEKLRKNQPEKPAEEAAAPEAEETLVEEPTQKNEAPTEEKTEEATEAPVEEKAAEVTEEKTEEPAPEAKAGETPAEEPEEETAEKE